MTQLNRAMWFAVLCMVLLAPQMTAQNDRLVGIVQNQQLRTSFLYDSGIDGLERFEQSLRDMNVTLVPVTFTEPVSPELDLLLLVRPLAGLSNVQMIYLYQYLEQGNHLLLAIDPPDFQASASDLRGSELGRLLAQEYGIILQDTLLTQPWFTVASLNQPDLNSARVFVRADDVIAHPIVEPLVRFDLPLVMWAGRSLDVEPFGVFTEASNLAFTETAWGETNLRGIARPQDNQPLQLNIGTDFIGRLPVAALGENHRTGSRVVVIGDSEGAQNLFGYSIIEPEFLPRNPGNVLFVERAIAWLLDMPQTAWPDLSQSFIQLGVDGVAEDWTAYEQIPSVSNTNGLTATSVYNDFYAFVLLNGETASSVELSFTTPQGQAATIRAQQGSRAVSLERADGTVSIISDAAAAFGEVIELRLPLREVGTQPAFSRVCAQSCIEEPVRGTLVAEQDPAPLRIFDKPLGVVQTTAPINMRSGPGLGFPPVTVLSNNTQLAINGRNADSSWIQVENARYSGWIAEFLLRSSVEFNELPIIDGQ